MRLARGKLRSAPLFSDEADRWLPDVSGEERMRNAYFRDADGRLWRGPEAVWRVLYMIPGGWLLKPLRIIPGFSFFSEKVYRWVADRRTDSCRLPDTRS